MGEQDDDRTAQTGSPFGDREYDGGQEETAPDEDDIRSGPTGSPFGDREYDGGQKGRDAENEQEGDSGEE